MILFMFSDLSSLDLPSEFRPRSHSSSALHKKAAAGSRKLRCVKISSSKKELSHHDVYVANPLKMLKHVFATLLLFSFQVLKVLPDKKWRI